MADTETVDLVDRVPLARLVTLAGQLISIRIERRPEFGDLLVTDWRVLMTLALLPVTRARDVAVWSGLKASTLTSASRRLIARGLIEQRVGADRREHHFVLTEPGRTALAPMLASGQDIAADVLDGLTPEQRDAIHGALAILVRRLVRAELAE